MHWTSFASAQTESILEAMEHRSVTVRPAKRDELDEIAEIWKELMDLHEGTDVRFALAKDSVAQWCVLAEDTLSRDDAFLSVADTSDGLGGFCLGWVAQNPSIYRVNRVGFISEIAVRSALRRRGLGRLLVQHARDWFAERGLTELQLSTAVWNEGAQEFWKSLGGEPLLVRFCIPTRSDRSSQT